MTEEDKELNLIDRVVLLEHHMTMMLQLVKVQQTVLKELTPLLPKHNLPDKLFKPDTKLVLPN